MSYYYLATPYSKYPRGIEVAFLDACKIAAEFMDAGIPIFCPIAHTHPIAAFSVHDARDSAFWQTTNEGAIRGARSGLIVMKMEGWENSAGIAAEIIQFRQMSRPILYCDLDHIPEMIHFLRGL